jgi:hypothetical protein
VAEIWLSGPVPGIGALLQPVAHALLQAAEDVERVAAAIGPDDLWRRPGSAASLGFHLKHLSGATERLMSYGLGRSIGAAERDWLGLEGREGEPPMDAAALARRFRSVVDAALAELARYPDDRLTEPRSIGRAQLPTTALGCFVHAGEHAARHAGQLVTTAKFLTPGG